MSTIGRGFNILSEEDRDRLTEAIIAYFHDERGEDIGVIAAGNVLDFFLDNVGPDIYNKAVEDAKALLKTQFDGLDVEFDLLKRQK